MCTRGRKKTLKPKAKRNPVKSLRLRGLMAENEMTTAMLAKKIGISELTLQLKITGERAWWFWETLEVSKVFGYDSTKDVFPEMHKLVMESA